jgi:hypothetical protein
MRTSRRLPPPLGAKREEEGGRRVEVARRAPPREGLPLLLGLTMLAAPLAEAQDPPPPPITPQGGTPAGQTPTTRPAIEPTGFPGLPGRDPRLPPPQDDQPQTVRVIAAERLTREGSLMKLRGQVHVQYKGYDIFAREVDGDLTTDIFTLRGGAQLIGKDAVVLGETVTVDFRAETFRAQETVAEIRPGFLEGRTLDSVYLRGGEVWGSEREIFGHDCGFTTCTYDEPHYELESARANLRPQRRIILRKVRFELLGRRLFEIPYVSIPLDTRRQRYTPEVGRTPEEGYFIKTDWGIPIRGNNSLTADVDYFEKLGAGLGGLFQYWSGQSEGYLRAYALTGNSQTVEVQSGHRQSFGRLFAQVENNYQQRNYLNAPQNTILTTRATFTLPQGGRDSSRLSYFRTNNRSATFESTNQTVSLSDTRNLWGRIRTQLDTSWVRSDSQFTGGGSQREQVDVRFRGQQDLKKALAELEYQRSIPVGETNNFFSASDKTPVLTLRSDSNRLFGRDFKLPFQAEFSMGEFVDPREKDRVSRTNFDIRSQYSHRGQGPLTYSLDGRFKQSFYSDDTAQYAVGYGAFAGYRLGHDTSLNFRYNYLEREGFTPLAIDRIGKTNLATADLSYRPIRTLLVGLQTGYDFLLEERGEPTAWQPVGLRFDWRPKEWFQLRALPVYDPLRQIWSQVRFDLAWQPGDTYVALGVRYDGFRKVWGATSLFVDALKIGRTKLSTLLTYNGYLKKFEERHYSLTYDLHCAEAILQVRESAVGFRSGREVYFFIRLKAFPFDTPFGLTRRGAPIGTATGR